MIQRIQGKCNYRRKTLEHISNTTGSFAAFASIGLVVMMTWQRSNGRKNERPKSRKVNDTNKDIPTQHEAKSVMFKSELPTQLIDFQIFPQHF